MANYRRTANGNWSTLAEWEVFTGSVWVPATQLPGIGDSAYANNFITILDMDIVVDELRSTTIPGVSNNGRFEYGAGCTTVIANCFSGATAAVANGVVNNATTGLKYFIGDSYAGSIMQAHGLVNTSTGGLIQTGNCFGGSGGTALTSNASGGTCNRGNGGVTINGNVFGSNIATQLGGCGALNNAGNMTINGICTNGTAGRGFYNASANQCFVHTMVNDSITTVGITEIVVNQRSLGQIRFNANGSYLTHLVNGTPIIFTASPNYPDESDVRDGIFYGPANIYEGNLEAGATPSEIWNHLLSNINTNDSIGKLLKDNIDATISSRSTQTSVDNINVDFTPILNELTDIESKVDIIDTNVDTVLNDLDNIEGKIDIIDTNVDNIPTNPLLTNDTRLNNLDATISSRASQTSVDNINVDFTPILNELTDIESKVDIIDTNIDTALTDLDNIEGKIDIIDTNVDNIPTNPLLDNDTRLNNLDATISSRLTTNGSVNVVQWRGNTPGNLDSNGFVPANVASINGNTVRANTLSTWLDNNFLDVKVSTRASQTSVDNINVDFTPVLTHLDNIESKVDIIDTNVDTVLNDLDNIESKVDIIDTNVDTVLNDLDNIEGKIDIIDTNVDTALNDLDNIEGKIDIIDTNVDTALNDLDNIENKIDNIDVDFTPVMDKIDEIPGEVIDELQTSTEPIAERLRNVSTVDTTGTIISNYNI